MSGDFSFLPAWKMLCSASRPVLVAHPHPDGDTLGAALAMWNALRLEKSGTGDVWRPVVFCADTPPENYVYMSGVAQVTSDRTVFLDADVICTFDAGDLVFAGIASEVASARARGGVRVMNVDHHATNQLFGDLNIVDVSACSTAEVVMRLLRCAGVQFTKDVATCLLTGILTDTSGFSNAGTTRVSFELAAELLRAGAKIQEVQRHVVRNMPIGGLRLWGSALERLKYDEARGMATTMVMNEDYVRHALDDEHAEGISNFLNRCLMAESVMVLKERNGEVRGSLRTVSGERDVSQVAKKLGGGGHKKAAGFVMKGAVKEMPTGWGVVRK